MFTQSVVRSILKQLSQKKISAKIAYQKLKNLSYESLSFAKLDHHRLLRKNLPEVIYAPGKSLDQLIKIIQALNKSQAQVILTRLDPSIYQKLKKRFPKLKYSHAGKIAYLSHKIKKPILNSVAIVTAGTSDLSVAEEARITLELLGINTNSFYDVGVAGLHRLLDSLPEIETCKIVICIAGMEGALASVLAGLIARPIIAVPTSVGYGASFKGITPLLTMLSTCAQGVAVVNIDSGFNAACFAHLIFNTVS